MQGLELKLDIETDTRFSPEQIGDLLLYARNYADNRADLTNPCLTVELQPGGQQMLLFIGLIRVFNWRDYIELRESLTLDLNQLIVQVDKSHFVLSVSYDTTDQQLTQIPGILAGIIDGISGFELRACRLMNIAEFSYDFKCQLIFQGLTYNQFKDSIDQINREILSALAAAQIVIPFPTAIEIQRDEV